MPSGAKPEPPPPAPDPEIPQEEVKQEEESLTSHQVAVSLNAGTTTRTGLTVHAEHDTSSYQRGIKISDRQMRELENTHIARHDWHPQWNYTITPANAA